MQPAPAAPAGLAATPSSTSALVDIKWNGSPGATIYPIERRTGNSGSFAVIDSTAATSYRDTKGLALGTDYFYQVRACNSHGCSAYSNPAMTTTLPPVPASFDARIRPLGAAADLTWVPSPGATTYQLDYRTNPGMFSQLTTLNTGSASSYVHFASVSTGPVTTRWDYRIRACNGAGCSNNAQVAAH